MALYAEDYQSAARDSQQSGMVILSEIQSAEEKLCVFLDVVKCYHDATASSEAFLTALERVAVGGAALPKVLCTACWKRSAKGEVCFKGLQ